MQILIFAQDNPRQTESPANNLLLQAQPVPQSRYRKNKSDDEILHADARWKGGFPEKEFQWQAPHPSV